MIDRLTILAPGLLGGSVARAARDKAVARHITIWARRAETRAALAVQPWCDDAPESLPGAVAGASLVVIAAPVDLIVPFVEQIAPHLANGAIVTDVGSVKSGIAHAAAAALKRLSSPLPLAHFVGSHPMAGSEKTGWEHGSAALFERRTCFVTPISNTSETALRLVSGFWQALGADVVTVAPELHDQIVAHISHLPQVVASSLCAFLAGQNLEWRNFAGGGLRDTTRIAGSDPQLWRSILAANQQPVLAALRGLQAELANCERALAAGDWDGVAALISRGKEYRDGFTA
jgi:prephenate dehydrogenase